jgi:hypothetical protein
MHDDGRNQDAASNSPIHELPDCLKPFSKWLLPASALPPCFPPPAVYFLVRDGELTYIGKTISMETRLLTHRASGRVWDALWWWPVAEDAAEDLERVFIRFLWPPENREDGEPDQERAEIIASALGLGGPAREDWRVSQSHRPADVADLTKVWRLLTSQAKAFLVALAKEAPVIRREFSMGPRAHGLMPYISRVFKRQAGALSPVLFEGGGWERKLWLDVAVAEAVLALDAACQDGTSRRRWRGVRAA